MNETHIEAIKSLIYDKLSIDVLGSVDTTQDRKGLLFWFAGYNRGNGPVFSLRPSGLKRHTIILKFGAYAGPCIDHINQSINSETLELANAFMELLIQNPSLRLNEHSTPSWQQITPTFNISVNLKITEQKALNCIMNSVDQVMLPLMAACAELIGYEKNTINQQESETEGALTQSVIMTRERSPRNRLLCLSIHGYHCGVCGNDPSANYALAPGTLIEVHHIEPLSELLIPKVYNPVTDLMPLCPNCHRAIHRRKPAYTPEQLKGLL